MNDEYLHKTLDELLSDDAFIDWVILGKDSEKWNLWIANNVSSSQTIQEAKELASKIKFNERPVSKNLKNEVWNRIEENTIAKEVILEKKPIKTKTYSIIAVAASIALLCLFIFSDQSTLVQTDINSSQNIVLPAMSEIDIAPSSKVKYNKRTWDKYRSIELEGFAHFDVSKGRPFKVSTPTGVVEVLGTEFDVVSEDNTFYVKVDEGRVNASSGNKSEILTANTSFYVNPLWQGNYTLNEQWRSEQMTFIFRNQLCKDVLKTIPFVYNIEVDLSNIDEELRFTGSFNSAEQLEKVLEKILWPLNIEFEIINDRVLLKSE